MYLRLLSESMNMRINHIVLSLLTLLVISCGTRKAEQFQALPFPDVQLPGVISDQGDAMNYLAENYWNGLTQTSRNYPCDSLYVSGVEKGIVEQKFADCYDKRYQEKSYPDII